MWIVLLSCCMGVSLIMSLAFCICWRKKPPNDDWQGLDGMVTQKNPDENVNHLPSATCLVDGVPSGGDSSDAKRNVISNPRRSLPDIPSEQGNGVNWDPTGDNSSELYATVGQYQNQNSAKRHTIANGIETRPSISQHSSISQADDAFSPYERVNYEKIQSKEHPYAQLQPATSRVTASEEVHTSQEGVSLLRPDIQTSTVSIIEPVAPSRSRRSSSHSGGGGSSSSTVPDVVIPAASAVAGALAASPELPYMTPPLVTGQQTAAAASDNQRRDQQGNFSGDSQDSSKGYTSISVREPLANILAQTKEVNVRRRDIDPHYSTVSDDSDDVYTTIPDSENGGRVSSMTVEAEINHTPTTTIGTPPSDEDDDEAIDELYEPPPGNSRQPAPPTSSVGAGAGAVTTPAAGSGGGGGTAQHSRQASSSSSVTILGSPKPEKRQANSPLPPPPTACSFDFHSEKVQTMRNLDDLYAKVHKNNKKEDQNGDSSGKMNELDDSSVLPLGDFESKDTKRPRREHNYETLRKPRRTSDPGYEKIKDSGGENEPRYASINGPESISSSDPGYEVLKDRLPAESDPNYEELRHRTSNASDCSGYSRIKEKDINDGYSVVNKKKTKLTSLSAFVDDTEVIDEPNYESMPNDALPPPPPPHLQVAVAEDPVAYYSALNGSESDPNYETVMEKPSSLSGDPNYETVEEPPYERLGDDDISKTGSDVSSIGYERIRRKGCEANDISDGSASISKSLSERTEPPYEQLNNDTDSERIKSNKTLSPNSSGSSGDQLTPSEILDEDGIVQV